MMSNLGSLAARATWDFAANGISGIPYGGAFGGIVGALEAIYVFKFGQSSIYKDLIYPALTTGVKGALVGGALNPLFFQPIYGAGKCLNNRMIQAKDSCSADDWIQLGMTALPGIFIIGWHVANYLHCFNNKQIPPVHGVQAVEAIKES